MKRYGNLSLVSMLLLVLVTMLGSEVEAWRRYNSNIFGLLDYGGSSSNGFDNSKALISAWVAACRWSGGGGEEEAIVSIPPGTYLTFPVVLHGACTGPIVLRNNGKIMAPPGPTNAYNHLISFRNLERLTVDGIGSFDGQGSTYWKRRNPKHNDHALLDFSFVKNSTVEAVRLTNSKSIHLHVYACHDILLSRVTISSPGNSPNTDGIKISQSSNINIVDADIAAGDDCVAILTGTSNISIIGVHCGPGHGISIGSMGGKSNERVSDIDVRNVSFVGTLNGVRIKTWASTNPGVVSGVSFKDIVMKNVDNPIIIDQNYCPPHTCIKGDSHVQIQDIKFINIEGTSRKPVVLKLDCSWFNPCKDIMLQNINLRYVGSRRGIAVVVCSNVLGTSSGVQKPTACI